MTRKEDEKDEGLLKFVALNSCSNWLPKLVVYSGCSNWLNRLVAWRFRLAYAVRSAT